MPEQAQSGRDPARDEYLRYLEENGLSERSVLPMIQEVNEETQAQVETILRSAEKAGYHNLVRRHNEAATGDTNLLLTEMNRRLAARFTKGNLVIPSNVFTGVFPTNSLNAHVVKRAGGYLILINTGAFELIEAMAAILSSLEPGTARTQANMAAGLLRRYCDDRALPQPSEMKKLKLGFERMQMAVNVTTAIEEFVLAHEYGHLAHGDVGHAVAEIPSATGHSVLVAAKTSDQEFEADLWAAHALMSIGWDAADEDEHMIKCSGPLMFLSLAGVVEAYFERKGERFDTHPPASDRYLELRNAFAKAGLNSYADLGTTFNNFC